MASPEGAVSTVIHYWALSDSCADGGETPMKLLDKLRPQPKIKHADPTVRLEALQEIDDTDQATLTQMATEDPDARVRRAASGRLTEAAALAAIVRNEADAAARDHALARIVSLAEQSDERAGLSAVTALAALGRQR